MFLNLLVLQIWEGRVESFSKSRYRQGRQDVSSLFEVERQFRHSEEQGAGPHVHDWDDGGVPRSRVTIGLWRHPSSHTLDEPNQLSDATLASGTTRAGQEPRHR
jgi:hypothetical protein